MNQLATNLAHAGCLTCFVETGTFKGDSLSWAAENFKSVVTIEIREDFFLDAKKKFAHSSNLKFVLGDSATELGQLCPRLEDRALFWLDAHAGYGKFGETENCPLREELRAIMARPHDDVIVIDDAFAFLSPVPPPFDYRLWPSLDEILKILSEKNLYVVVFNDAIVAVPRALQGVVADYVRHPRFQSAPQ